MKGFHMAYRYGDRTQRILFPQSIDEYIPQDAPVRAYDAIVDKMDLQSMGFEIDPDKVGCPRYDPKIMLKLLVYGYSYGVRSSRKLERECHYNLSFIWLTAGLKPDHKTIAQFRRENRNALQKVIKQCAGICMELDLIDGNVLFIDGSKMRANASIDRTITKEKALKMLKHIDQRISSLLSECEQIDSEECGHDSWVHMQQELKDSRLLRDKIESALGSIEQQQKHSHNMTDEDCVMIHSRQGSHSGYNGQIAVDDKHGLIVNSDVVSENNDLKQFSVQVQQANEVLSKPCKEACADAGYSNARQLEKIDKQGTKVIVPSKQQASKNEPGPFDRSAFEYVEKEDAYICPCGQKLPYRWNDAKRDRREYVADIRICKSCEHFGLCTKGNKNGRRIYRNNNEQFRDRIEEQYAQAGSQEIYCRRKQKVELPFGHVKHNLKAGNFLLRGLAGVKAEMSILSSCFNIARIISIIGVSELLVRLVS
jgi:transposase